MPIPTPPKTYSFFWSPEGRCIFTFTGTQRAAYAAFKRACKPFAKCWGEIYIEVSE